MTKKHINQQLSDMHDPINGALVRALFFILTIMHIGLFMWQPEDYAAHIGGFNIAIGLSFIWCLCSAIIFSVGFRPIFWLWQILFSPYISGLLLIYFSFRYFV